VFSYLLVGWFVRQIKRLYMNVHEVLGRYKEELLRFCDLDPRILFLLIFAICKTALLAVVC